ncbi:hypothetical protein ONE63_009274 [Megalurothrips usitatus]|uniref:Uncharacterized protein n=1 Tax=Megalurothrips usitatus TaxID=439358 RepID=A0AAV7XMQ6_9NEOP|nr:hypothetical protein ONE63_009274 [Megalurothrips usitatus]
MASSNDYLTFTKSKIRSDEERLLIVQGYRNTLHLSLLLIVLSLSTAGAILLAVFWTTRHEAPFDVSLFIVSYSSVRCDSRVN